MGLSFHYSGRISKPELLPELIAEIQDIASVYKWKYFVFERAFPKNSFSNKGYNKNIYGINFPPTHCETISLCFLSNGRMSDFLNLKLYGKSDIQNEHEYLYMLSTKTQYAGIETHQFIIQLFRHLDKKYFSDFKMIDEGQYWETNDYEILKSNFKKYTNLINSFTSALECIPIKPDESIESYLIRLLKQLHDKNKLE